MNTVFIPSRLKGAVIAPASKSEAHRRMICAGLSSEESLLEGFMPSKDMTATRNCLEAIGACLQEDGQQLKVRGSARPAEKVPVMDCLESGSTLRFFVPIAMARTNGGIFRMHGRLGERPMDVYRDLFVPRGAKWQQRVAEDGVAELSVRGTLQPGDYWMPGNVSSQFVSGMLFALPLLSGDSTLTVEPPVESAGYIHMTLQALTNAGIRLEKIGEFAWRIPGNQQYHAVNGRLSGDYSQGAVFLCAAAMGDAVTIEGLQKETTQGDRAVLRCLEQLGAVIHEDAEHSVITVEDGKLHGAMLDMRDCPDIAPIVALTCQLAEGESRLTGCGRLRLKECDRLTATEAMLNALGGHVCIEGDDLLIRGVSKLKGGVTVDVCHDHRMVMLASIAALHSELPITVDDAGAVAKSWPDYLKVYEQLGGKMA